MTTARTRNWSCLFGQFRARSSQQRCRLAGCAAAAAAAGCRCLLGAWPAMLQPCLGQHTTLLNPMLSSVLQAVEGLLPHHWKQHLQTLERPERADLDRWAAFKAVEAQLVVSFDLSYTPLPGSQVHCGHAASHVLPPLQLSTPGAANASLHNVSNAPSSARDFTTPPCRYIELVKRINALRNKMAGLSDDELAAKTGELRFRIESAGLGGPDPGSSPAQILSGSADGGYASPGGSSRERRRAQQAEWRRRGLLGGLPEDVVVEAFAVVREAAHRVLGMRHYDVQLVSLGWCVCYAVLCCACAAALCCAAVLCGAVL